MINSLQAYPEYKDSGLPWFGAIPSHWKLPRLGHILHERGEVNKNDEVTEVLSLLRDRGVIPYADKGNIGNKKSEDITRYKIVRPRDIVVNCMNVIIGSVGISRYTGCLSPVYYVLRTRYSHDLPEYFDAVFKIKPFQRSLTRIGKGILAHRMRIPMELLKCELMPRPPADEQAKIVRYLNEMDRRIARFIRNRRRLIEVLNEQKQAIINQAVTRGLDPNAPLKPSGIDWLGNIPEHWEVGPLKRFVSSQPGAIKAGPFGSQLTAAEMSGADFKVYTQRNVIDRDLDAGINFVTRSKFETMRAFEVFPGDVLVTSRGTIGRTVLVPAQRRPGILHPCLLRVQPDQHRLIPEFLMTLIQDSQLLPRQLTLLSNATTINVIYSSTLANVVVPVPPIDEQRSIIEAIENETALPTAAIDKAKREINLIRGYRTRLIADVVTGKVDVRHLAPTPGSEDLQETTDELEPPDDVADELDDEALAGEVAHAD